MNRTVVLLLLYWAKLTAITQIWCLYSVRVRLLKGTAVSAAVNLFAMG